MLTYVERGPKRWVGAAVLLQTCCLICTIVAMCVPQVWRFKRSVDMEKQSNGYWAVSGFTLNEPDPLENAALFATFNCDFYEAGCRQNLHIGYFTICHQKIDCTQRRPVCTASNFPGQGHVLQHGAPAYNTTTAPPPLIPAGQCGIYPNGTFVTNGCVLTPQYNDGWSCTKMEHAPGSRDAALSFHILAMIFGVFALCGFAAGMANHRNQMVLWGAAGMAFFSGLWYLIGGAYLHNMPNDFGYAIQSGLNGPPDATSMATWQEFQSDKVQGYTYYWFWIGWAVTWLTAGTPILMANEPEETPEVVVGAEMQPMMEGGAAKDARTESVPVNRV